MIDFKTDFELIEKTLRNLIDKTPEDTTERDVYECIFHKIKNIKGYKCETCIKRNNNIECPAFYSKRNKLPDDWFCADCDPIGIGAGGMRMNPIRRK